MEPTTLSMLAIGASVGISMDIYRLPHFDRNEIICLAQNIFYEARNSTFEDRRQVAITTINRKKDRRWPKTICEVVYQASQFSWTNEINKLKPITASEAWNHAQRLAKDVFYYSDSLLRALDLCGGSTHFYSHVIWKDKRPKWANHVDPKNLCRVGDHTFLKAEG
jgi:spore germination cell wall hydrolase CwlJ-like protein